MGKVDLSFVDAFKELKLLVAGEVGIDEYLWGEAHRISPEAPVPVVEVHRQSRCLGLAGNVAQNIVSLGGGASLVSVRGADDDGLSLQEMVHKAGIREARWLDDDSRPTLRKVRVLAQKQHVVRVDYERSHPLSASLSQQFRETLCDLIADCDGVIVQDYGKGIWNDDSMGFVQHAKAHRCPIFVDPSRLANLATYRGVDFLTPNRLEAFQLCAQPVPTGLSHDEEWARIEALGRKILSATEAEHTIITCGAEGMVAFSRGASGSLHIPTFAREVFDVTGAGDTVIAVLALMITADAPLPLAMKVANAAAGIVVGHIGAACVTPVELKAELKKLQDQGLL